MTIETDMQSMCIVHLWAALAFAFTDQWIRWFVLELPFKKICLGTVSSVADSTLRGAVAR